MKWQGGGACMLAFHERVGSPFTEQTSSQHRQRSFLRGSTITVPTYIRDRQQHTIKWDSVQTPQQETMKGVERLVLECWLEMTCPASDCCVVLRAACCVLRAAWLRAASLSLCLSVCLSSFLHCRTSNVVV